MSRPPFQVYEGGLSKRGGRGRDGRGDGPREPPIVAGRVPPHDLDAEAAVLSSCMLGHSATDPIARAAVDMVLEFLLPHHFYSDSNGRIFEAIMQLALVNTPVDIQTVASYLRDRERLAQIGGASYLAQIADATPFVAHVTSYAQVVVEKWRLRNLIWTCQKTAAEGYGDVGEVQEFIDGHEQAVHELAHMQRDETVQPLAQVLQAAFRDITEAAERGDRITGMSTGYEKLDAKTAGMHRGDLTIVAGRPGMGKTAFVTGLAVNMASPRVVEAGVADGQKVQKHAIGHGAIIFSLEMPRKQLGVRMTCTEGRVDLGKMRQGYLQPDDWRRLTEAGSFLSSLPIWVDDTAAISLMEVRAKVRRIQAQFNRPATATEEERKIGLVVIDYMQLMSGTLGVSREQVVSEISRGLKNMAKELDVPVVALSQLNRSVETRPGADKRPHLSDLRESGQIEADADMIIFIYRDEYYHPETTSAKGLAELIIAKQRNGPLGKVLTRFTGSCTRFDNLAAGDYPEMTDDD